MSAGELFEVYKEFGDEPMIIPDPEEKFSAWGFAWQECQKMCQ